MIAAYLSKLAGALAFDPALAARVVIEAREHLTDAAAEDACVDRDEAERRAVARFGDPATLRRSSLPSRWPGRPGASVSSSCSRSSSRSP